MPNRQKIREVLADIAAELSQSRWPVDVEDVARTLGIRVEVIAESGSQPAAHLSMRGRPTIAIRTSAFADPHKDNFNRFSIAHEIGHWIIWRRFGLLPARNGEYWEHERLCNEFAANLLVPITILSRHLQTLHQRRVHPLHYPRSVAVAAEVSWQVAARSIAAIPDCADWYVRISLNGDPRVLITCSTVQECDNYVGDRAKISDIDLSNSIRELHIGKIVNMPLSFIAGSFRIRSGGAFVLRERAQRATILFPKRSTEIVRLTANDATRQSATIPILTAPSKMPEEINSPGT